MDPHAVPVPGSVPPDDIVMKSRDEPEPEDHSVPEDQSLPSGSEPMEQDQPENEVQ